MDASRFEEAILCDTHQRPHNKRPLLGGNYGYYGDPSPHLPEEAAFAYTDNDATERDKQEDA